MTRTNGMRDQTKLLISFVYTGCQHDYGSGEGNQFCGFQVHLSLKLGRSVKELGA